MEISEEKIRDFIDKKTNEIGIDATIEYIRLADYSPELKEFAIGIMVKNEPDENLLAENGDISDFGI